MISHVDAKSFWYFLNVRVFAGSLSFDDPEFSRFEILDCATLSHFFVHQAIRILKTP